ncbi:MAG: hypothetical protein FJW35_05400 [Acidobacteria bacterium]|nr:hypothetical protein [Acidobacteriota bacterium]
MVPDSGTIIRLSARGDCRRRSREHGPQILQRRHNAYKQEEPCFLKWRITNELVAGRAEHVSTLMQELARRDTGGQGPAHENRAVPSCMARSVRFHDPLVPSPFARGIEERAGKVALIGVVRDRGDKVSPCGFVPA